MSRRSRGMTLIELSVVLALVGVFTALSVTSYQRLTDKRRSGDTARELWASAQVARQRAQARRQVVRFVVEPVAVDGRTRNVARWEQLPCDNTWGSGACPVAACDTNTCRTGGGCTCAEVGPDILVPDEMTASALDGLCFQAGTGRPLTGTSGRNCREGGTPGNRDVPLVVSGAPSTAYYLRLDGLTGMALLLDCAAHGTACPEPDPE